jgi:hypothetical protein
MVHRTRYFVIASLLVLVVGLGTGLVAYYVGFPGGGFPGGQVPPQLSFVASDAPVVAYADIHQLMASDLRRRLREALPSPVNGQREFAEHTGIDIERDVDSVLGFLGASATNRQEPRGLAIIRGRFDRQRIEALLRGHGGQEETHSGTTLMVAPEIGDSSKSFGLAFLAEDLIGVGHVEELRAAIDRKAGGGATTNGDLMDRVRGVFGQSAWVVGRFDALVSSGHLPADVVSDIPPITWLSGSARFDNTIHLKLQAEARDAQAAKDLRELITGVLAIGKLQRGVDPQLADLAKSIALGGSGATVTLAFDLPSQILDKVRLPGAPQRPSATP